MIFSINHTRHDYAYVLGNLEPRNVPSVISGFRRKENEICTLLGW